MRKDGNRWIRFWSKWVNVGGEDHENDGLDRKEESEGGLSEIWLPGCFILFLAWQITLIILALL